MKDYLYKQFLNNFKCEPDSFISCGGRFEILGNHTDHNHGLCLAATCDLSIKCAVKKRDDLKVYVISEGNRRFNLSLKNLNVVNYEKFTSKSLIRGVGKYLKDHGYSIGGFNVYMTSNIFKGAGVSSSAAFELLIAQIFNELFNDFNVPKMVLCKAGQYAENVYFGKKSGLLDQIGVAYGGISYIDFVDIDNPYVNPMTLPFDDLHFLIVNTGGSHSDLSDAYSAIPNDMYSAANKMGCKYLIEGSIEKLEQIKDKLTDLEYSRALHFYQENERVRKAKEAILNKDEETFLKMIDESRISSTNYLKNMMVENEYVGSPLEACDFINDIIKGHGAVKINGGGFAGSVICLVKDTHYKLLKEKASLKYGNDNVMEVYVREKGPSNF